MTSDISVHIVSIASSQQQHDISSNSHIFLLLFRSLVQSFGKSKYFFYQIFFIQIKMKWKCFSIKSIKFLKFRKKHYQYSLSACEQTNQYYFTMYGKLIQISYNCKMCYLHGQLQYSRPRDNNNHLNCSSTFEYGIKLFQVK